MADQKISEFHQSHFNALKEHFGSYHTAIEELTAEEARIQQQKAFIKATALSELSQLSALKLSNEAIGVLAIACW